VKGGAGGVKRLRAPDSGVSISLLSRSRLALSEFGAWRSGGRGNEPVVSVDPPLHRPTFRPRPAMDNRSRHEASRQIVYRGLRHWS
jgi:hypothetical protein